MPSRLALPSKTGAGASLRGATRVANPALWPLLILAATGLVVSAIFGVVIEFLGAAVVLPLLWAILQRPQRGILALAALVPFDGMLEIVHHSALLQYWKEILVVFVLAATFFAPAEARAPKGRRPRPAWLAGLLGWLALGVISAGVVGGSAAVYGLRLAFFFCLVTWAAWRCPLDAKERDRLITILIGTGAIQALIAILEQGIGATRLNNLGFPYNTTIRFAGSFLRSFGTFSYPQVLGFFMMIVILIGATFALADLRRTRSRFFVSMLPLYLAAMILSVTRGALLGTALGAAYLAWRRYRAMLVLLPLAAVAFLFVPSNLSTSLLSSTSAQERVATWSAVLPSVASAPLGHGIGTSGSAVGRGPIGSSVSAAQAASAVQPSSNGASASGATGVPDNYYVLTVLELGIPGFWLFVLMLLAIFMETRRAGGRLRGEPSHFCEAVSAMTLAAIVAALFETYFEIFPMDFYFWLFVGVAAATWAGRVESPEASEVGREPRTALASRSNQTRAPSDR